MITDYQAVPENLALPFTFSFSSSPGCCRLPNNSSSQDICGFSTEMQPLNTMQTGDCQQSQSCRKRKLTPHSSLLPGSACLLHLPALGFLPVPSHSDFLMFYPEFIVIGNKVNPVGAYLTINKSRTPGLRVRKSKSHLQYHFSRSTLKLSKWSLPQYLLFFTEIETSSSPTENFQTKFTDVQH